MKKITNQTFDLIQAGVTTAFNGYYRAYRTVFFQFTLSIVKSNEVAQDIVSDAYLICWERRLQFRSMKELHAYLYVICKHRAYDFIKYGSGFKNKKELLLEDLSLSSIEDHDTRNEIIRNEFIRDIYLKIRELPGQRRKVLTLLFINGMSVDETAIALNISKNAVYVIKSQALIQLRGLLGVASTQCLVSLMSSNIVSFSTGPVGVLEDVLQTLVNIGSEIYS